MLSRLVWTIIFSFIVPLSAQNVPELDDPIFIERQKPIRVRKWDPLADEDEEFLGDEEGVRIPSKKRLKKKKKRLKKKKVKTVKKRSKRKTTKKRAPKKRASRKGKATIQAEVVNLYREPDRKADLVTKLHQSDIVIILEAGEEFSYVRYFLEGGFPIEGYIPTLALGPMGSKKDVSPNTQPYRPRTRRRRPPLRKVEALPKTRLPKSAFADTPSAPLRKRNMVPPDKTTVRKTFRGSRDKGWGFALGLGLNIWEEALKTKDINTDTYFSGSFLNYKLTGILLQMEANYDQRFPEFVAGGRLHYDLSIFSDSVSTTNDNIKSSSVLAVLHEPYLEGFIKKKYKFGQTTVEPELSLSAHFQLFLINQLKDVDPADLSRPGQPVLFNMGSYFARIRLIPRIYLPRDLLFEPEVGVIVYYNFFEGPTQTKDAIGNERADEDKIRTGAPKPAFALFQYGATIAWQAREIGFPFSEIRFSFLIRDLSRQYSGRGNRAGIATEDVKADTTLTSYGLSFVHRF